MDGLLRAAWEERGADLPLLRHQPPDVLPLAEALPTAPARQPGGAFTPAPTGAPTHLVAGARPSRLRVARAVPRWGKDKRAPLLREAGWSVSTSMVSRILS